MCRKDLLQMLWDVLGAHVVRRVRGPCCGTCSGPMLWDVFGAHVVGRVWGPCCGTCSGPMLWDVFGSGRGQGIGRSAEGGHEPTKPSIKHPSTKGAAILGMCRKELLQASIDERNCNFGMCRKELPQASIDERICNFGMCRKVLLQASIDERSCNFWHV